MIGVKPLPKSSLHHTYGDILAIALALTNEEGFTPILRRWHEAMWEIARQFAQQVDVLEVLEDSFQEQEPHVYSWRVTVWISSLRLWKYPSYWEMSSKKRRELLQESQQLDEGLRGVVEEISCILRQHLTWREKANSILDH